MKEVFILFCYDEYYETFIGETYDSYTKAYDRKKELLADKFNRNSGIADIDIIKREVK